MGEARGIDPIRRGNYCDDMGSIPLYKSSETLSITSHDVMMPLDNWQRIEENVPATRHSSLITRQSSFVTRRRAGTASEAPERS